MLPKRLAVFISFFALSIAAHAQQAVSGLVARDPQALTVVQQSIAAMAQVFPSDSTAQGTVQVVVGPDTTTGTVRILTKGTAESSIQMVTGSSTDTVVYSNNQANESVGTALNTFSLERTQVTQSAEFPLPLIAGLVNNPDVAFQYIGLETLNGQSTNHIRATDTYASQPPLQSLAQYSTRDIWFNTASGLPVRISCVRRDADGASPGIAVDVFFSNYQSFQGVLYPTNIQESLNGTPWATITIQTVSFNSGLSDTSFPIQQAGATQ